MRNIIITDLIGVFPRLGLGSDDFQYWAFSTAKAIDTKNVDFNVHGQIRYKNDVSETALYLVSPQLQLDLYKNLSFGLNYTRLQSRKTNKKTGSAR